MIPLKKTLEEQFARRNKILAPGAPLAEVPPGRLLIQADKDANFGKLKDILYTASVAGYSDYEFVVNNPDAD